MPPAAADFALLSDLFRLISSKTSSSGLRPASKRVGKGFAAKDNAGVDTNCRISVLSPPASSEADLGLADLAQAEDRIQIQEGLER